LLQCTAGALTDVECETVNLCGFMQTSVAQPSQQRFSVFLDSSSDSAGSSDAEYSDSDVLESNTKGEVVKEGFLMKKVITLILIICRHWSHLVYGL